MSTCFSILGLIDVFLGKHAMKKINNAVLFQYPLVDRCIFGGTAPAQVHNRRKGFQYPLVDRCIFGVPATCSLPAPSPSFSILWWIDVFLGYLLTNRMICDIIVSVSSGGSMYFWGTRPIFDPLEDACFSILWWIDVFLGLTASSTTSPISSAFQYPLVDRCIFGGRG